MLEPNQQPKSLTELSLRLHLSPSQARRWLIEELDRHSRLILVGEDINRSDLHPNTRRSLRNWLKNPQRYLQNEINPE
jgi:hypothetical protein